MGLRYEDDAKEWSEAKRKRREDLELQPRTISTPWAAGSLFDTCDRMFGQIPDRPREDDGIRPSDHSDLIRVCDGPVDPGSENPPSRSSTRRNSERSRSRQVHNVAPLNEESETARVYFSSYESALLNGWEDV